MKKIINGKIYDTEKAKKVGCFQNEHFDLSYLSECLYRKKTGEFFLYGEGGANTKYATLCTAGHWSGSSAIIPMTYNNAREWAEEHLEVDEYESIFGHVSEDGTKTQMCINISTSTAEKLRRMASEKEKSISTIIEELVKERVL